MSLAEPSIRPVLVFDSTDPTGAGGVQGAVLTLAAEGCLPLSVVTAIACSDTRGVEQIFPLDVDWVIEQARPLLEDMHVAAILVGDPGSLETLSAIAEISADYPVPLVFAPGDLRDSPDPDEGDDLVAAAIELLLPQTTVLVVEGTVAQRMVNAVEDEAEIHSVLEAAEILHKCGAAHVLLADGRDAALQAVDTLYGAGGIVRADVRAVPGRRIAGMLPTLAAALAAGLAAGLGADRAVERAQRHLAAALVSPQRPGMGAGQPDRLAALRGARG